jgi:hypothetical protein
LICAVVVQLTGSVIESPHGLHWNAYKFSPKARLIVCMSVIGRPQTGQMTSLVVGVTSLLIIRVWMQWRVPAMMQINCVCDFGAAVSLSAEGVKASRVYRRTTPTTRQR